MQLVVGDDVVPLRLLASVAIVGMLMIPVGVGSAEAFGFAQLGSDNIEPDQLRLQVSLDESGDAVWRIEYRIVLDDENTTEAFESLRADINENPEAFTDRFGDRMTRTVSTAENVTGRPMTVTNVSVSTARTGLPEEYGIVQYSFTWGNFGVVSGEEIRAGDAISGLFFDADTSLRIAWPGEYHLQGVVPDPDEERDTSVVWRGPEEFSSTEPRLVVSTSAPSEPTPSNQQEPWFDSGVAGIMLVVLVILGGLGWVVYARYLDENGTARDQQSTELLSNEEQVLSLIEDRGGRIKQQEIVDALGWTDAKTSQVVKSLREDGEIEGFRLGRENVLSLPEEDDES